MKLRKCALNRNGLTGETKVAHDNLCNPEEALIEVYVFTREELEELLIAFWLTSGEGYNGEEYLFKGMDNTPNMKEAFDEFMKKLEQE